MHETSECAVGAAPRKAARDESRVFESNHFVQVGGKDALVWVADNDEADKLAWWSGGRAWREAEREGSG